MGNHSSNTSNTNTGSDCNVSFLRSAPVFSMMDEVKSIHGSLSVEDKQLFKFASDAVEREKEKLGNTEISILFRHRGAIIIRSGGEKGAELKHVHIGFNEKNEPEWRLSVDEYAVDNFQELSDIIPRAVPL